MLTNQRIEELINGINHYLQKINGFSDNLREVKATLDELRHSKEKDYLCELEKMRIELKAVKHELQKRGLPEISEYESQFRELKELVMSESWPRAVDPRAIIITEDSAFLRAQQILDVIISESLTGKSFLDYGCGEGHVVMQAMHQNPKVVIGYDIKPSQVKFNHESFTSEFDFVRLKGPYDLILLHDVLDHLENISPEDALKQIKSVMSENGKLFVRCHPWCSRHGTHLYTTLNKAYAHLVLDESELCRLGGYANNHVIKSVNPIESYKNWFSESGFKICYEHISTKTPEDFFKKEGIIRTRLLNHWDGDSTRMLNSINIEFAEYILEPILNDAIL